jgi:hypothetical protein
MTLLTWLNSVLGRRRIRTVITPDKIAAGAISETRRITLDGVDVTRHVSAIDFRPPEPAAGAGSETAAELAHEAVLTLQLEPVDFEAVMEAFREATWGIQRATAALVPPPAADNVRFDASLLRAAGVALATELGINPDHVVDDEMPLWFDTSPDESGYTWHYSEYQYDDGRVQLAPNDAGVVDVVTVPRSVQVTTEQVDRYYEAITIREGATT